LSDTGADAGDDAVAVTVVSYNRPLTRAALRALGSYGIVEERAPQEHGRWTEVDLAEEPPSDILEKHELSRDRDPRRVYESPGGERVEIYDDEVTVGGRVIDKAPSDAIDHAEEHDWEMLSDEE